MDIPLFLAQAVDPTAAGGWDAKVLGPLSGLVIALTVLVVYARYTETVRIKKLQDLLKEAKSEAKQADKDHDQEVARIRTGYEAREGALRRQLNAYKDRHNREKTRRIFFQTECSALARKHGEEVPQLPTEISATSYQHRPVPKDPDPDDFKVDSDMPPVP